jgi:hypothetical protein
VFNPLSLSPALWLDFSDQSTLFDATSGGSNVVDGGAIARVVNKGTISGSFTQSTLNDRPLWDADGRNGRGVANLDGTTDFLDGTAAFADLFRNVSQGYIFAVAQDTNPSGGTSGHPLLVEGFSASTRLFLGTRNTTDTNTSGGRRLSTDAFVSSTAPNGSGYVLLEGAYNWGAGNVGLFVDGVAATVANYTSGAGNSQNISSDGIYVGKNVTGVSFFPGNIMHILAFNSTLTASQITQLRTWLAQQAAVTLA